MVGLLNLTRQYKAMGRSKVGKKLLKSLRTVKAQPWHKQSVVELPPFLNVFRCLWKTNGFVPIFYIFFYLIYKFIPQQCMIRALYKHEIISFVCISCLCCRKGDLYILIATGGREFLWHFVTRHKHILRSYPVSAVNQNWLFTQIMV